MRRLARAATIAPSSAAKASDGTRRDAPLINLHHRTGVAMSDLLNLADAYYIVARDLEARAAVRGDGLT
jgi:hypothetical protein